MKNFTKILFILMMCAAVFLIACVQETPQKQNTDCGCGCSDCTQDGNCKCKCKPGEGCGCKPIPKNCGCGCSNCTPGRNCKCSCAPGGDCPCKLVPNCSCGCVDCTQDENCGCDCKPGTGCGCKPIPNCGCGCSNCTPSEDCCSPNEECECACEPGAKCLCKPKKICKCGCKDEYCSCECEPDSGCDCKEIKACECEPGSVCCGCEPDASTDHNPSKYVFLFIGDGMGKNQVIAPEYDHTEYYYRYQASYDWFQYDPFDISYTAKTVEFARFPVTGSITTSSLTTINSEHGEPTDSAAAATALATGRKTNNYSISANKVDGKEVKFRSIAEYARNAGMKVGITTTVTITHATPSAFYAKILNRWDEHLIAPYLLKSHFDYFAGGNILDSDFDSDKFLVTAKSAGYHVARNRTEFEALSASSGKVFAIPPDKKLGRESSLQYYFDRDPEDEEHWTISDITRKGIEVLENPNGFFIMIEAGKVDWACHESNLKNAIGEVLDLDLAIGVAVKFAEKYPNETLIVVTADHETGGMEISPDGRPGGEAIPDGRVMFTDSGHTGADVDVFAYGANSSFFGGDYDNTGIFFKLARAMKLEVDCPCRVRNCDNM